MLPALAFFLTKSFSYSMLKTFVLSDFHAIHCKATTADTKAELKAAGIATTTDTSYPDDNIQVSLTEKRLKIPRLQISQSAI